MSRYQPLKYSTTWRGSEERWVFSGAICSLFQNRWVSKGEGLPHPPFGSSRCKDVKKTMMSSLFSSFVHYLPAASIILLPNVWGTLSSFITRGEPRWEWYRSLKKPSFNPPNWVFGPVWTAIYACMGVSSYLVFKQGGFAAQSVPLALYGAQLLLNWLWSPIFFYFHRIDLVKNCDHYVPMLLGESIPHKICATPP